MKEQFGLRVPQGALSTVLKRSYRKGYVTRADRLYRRNDRALAAIDLSRVRGEVLRQHEALLRKLIEFCRTRHNVVWSSEEGEAALLLYLQERSTPVLAAAIEGRPIPEASRLVKDAEFLVNAFILELHTGDPGGFEFLETIVKGSMLANALLLPDLSDVARRFGRVEVYFDTPFVLRALGRAGPSLQVAPLELINLLFTLNVDLRVFQHTYEEIYRVLEAAARGVRDSSKRRYAYGEVVEQLIESDVTPSDVELLLARLPRLVSSLHIVVQPKPTQVVELGLNELRLETILREEVRYSRDEALYHDLDALTAIHRLRAGRTHTH